MRPGKALKLFMNQLSNYERGEILDYQDIYFLGLTSEKVHGSPKEEFNYGFDDDKGDYNVILKDHIGYRYEIMGFLGKGSFGTVIKII
jgi:dual specificity tyrosine-phosphorylation-regulated kinase 2/3/4